MQWRRNWALKQVCCKYFTSPRNRNEGKGLLHKENGSDQSTALRVEGLLWGVPEHILSMAPWRCTRCCSWYFLANIREKGWPARVHFPHLSHYSVWGLDQEPLPPIPVGHREEVVGWHRCARQVVSLQECTPRKSICSRMANTPIHMDVKFFTSTAICCPRQ